MNFRRRNIRIVARFTMENPPLFQLSFLLFCLLLAFSGGTGAERVKVLLPFYFFTLLPLKAFLPFYLFYVRNQNILINLTIVLMGSKPERNSHQLARCVLTLRHIAEHCRSVLVLILAAHLLENDVTFHHLAVLTFLTLYSEGLALLHHSHNLSIHTI